jgi:hypothetical protein
MEPHKEEAKARNGLQRHIRRRSFYGSLRDTMIFRVLAQQEQLSDNLAEVSSLHSTAFVFLEGDYGLTSTFCFLTYEFLDL